MPVLPSLLPQSSTVESAAFDMTCLPGDGVGVAGTTTDRERLQRYRERARREPGVLVGGPRAEPCA